MSVLIIIYAFLNGLITGRYYGKEFYYEEHRWWAIVTMIANASIGCVWVAIGLICSVIQQGWKKLNAYIQIVFWWKFYFTKYYDAMSEDELKTINFNTQRYFSKDTYSHRQYRRCTDAVNKRHSYVYEPA